MCGTAAEVTPVRSVDDHEIGDPGPVTKAIQDVYFEVVRGARRPLPAVAGVRGEDSGRRRDPELGPGEIGLSAPWIGAREEELVLEMLRSGRLSLGPMIDRFEARWPSASARRTSRPSRAAPPGCISACAWPGSAPATRSITSPFSFVASANCVLYEGATPVFADIDPERSTSTRPRSRRRSRRGRRRSSPSTSSATRASSTSCERSPSEHGLAFIEDACEALGAEYRGRPLGSFAHPAVFAFYPEQADDDRRGRRGRRPDEEEWRLLKSLANQGRADSGGWLDARALRLQLPPRRPLGRRRPRAGRAPRRDPRAARGDVAARYAELLAGVDGVETPLRRRRRPPALVVRLRVRLAAGIDRERVIARLAERGIASKPLPAVDPPAAVHARALRLPRRHAPGRRRRRAAALLALPFFTRPRRGRAGARGRRSSRGRSPEPLAIIPTWLTARRDGLPRLRQVRRAPTGSTRSSRSRDDDRGGGRRTLVWVEGISEPIVASRTERTILSTWASATRGPVVEGRRARRARRRSPSGSSDAPPIKAEAGVDLDELARRARRLLEATAEAGRGRAAVLSGRSRREFFARSVHEVAPELIGCTLLVDGVGGRIVEVEAYDADDPASHSFRGPTPRNRVDVRPARARLRLPLLRHPLVPQPRLRAEGWPRPCSCGRSSRRTGSSRWRAARLDDERLLCSGPGRLCQALGVTGEHDGLPLDVPPFELLAADAAGRRSCAAPRVGITRAAELPWRYGLAGPASSADAADVLDGALRVPVVVERALDLEEPDEGPDDDDGARDHPEAGPAADRRARRPSCRSILAISDGIRNGVTNPITR